MHANAKRSSRPYRRMRRGSLSPRAPEVATVGLFRDHPFRKAAANARERPAEECPGCDAGAASPQCTIAEEPYRDGRSRLGFGPPQIGRHRRRKPRAPGPRTLPYRLRVPTRGGAGRVVRAVVWRSDDVAGRECRTQGIRIDTPPRREPHGGFLIAAEGQPAASKTRGSSRCYGLWKYPDGRPYSGVCCFIPGRTLRDAIEAFHNCARAPAATRASHVWSLGFLRGLFNPDQIDVLQRLGRTRLAGICTGTSMPANIMLVEFDETLVVAGAWPGRAVEETGRGRPRG